MKGPLISTPQSSFRDDFQAKHRVAWQRLHFLAFPMLVLVLSLEFWPVGSGPKGTRSSHSLLRRGALLLCSPLLCPECRCASRPGWPLEVRGERGLTSGCRGGQFPPQQACQHVQRNEPCWGCFKSALRQPHLHFSSYKVLWICLLNHIHGQ